MSRLVEGEEELPRFPEKKAGGVAGVLSVRGVRHWEAGVGCVRVRADETEPHRASYRENENPGETGQTVAVSAGWNHSAPSH